MKNVALLILACSFVACTDEDNTVRTLRAAGFTNISTTGYSLFACSDDDAFHTGFRAMNSRGEMVTGTVCCGFLTKGCTVRF